VLIIGLTKNPEHVNDILKGLGLFETQFDIGKIDEDGLHEIHVNNLEKSMKVIKDDLIEKVDISDDMDEFKSETDRLKEKISELTDDYDKKVILA
jgi:hypothetical protein